MRVDGSVAATGGSGFQCGSGGAGGAIFISCVHFSGSGAGALLAQGGNSGPWVDMGGGGGGRIAVWYGQLAAAAAQKITNGQENLVADLFIADNSPAFAGSISVAGGTNLLTVSTHAGEPGTVRFLRLLPRGVLIQVQ